MQKYHKQFGNFISARMGPYFIIYFGEPADIEVCCHAFMHTFCITYDGATCFPHIHPFNKNLLGRLDVTKVYHKVR